MQSQASSGLAPRTWWWGLACLLAFWWPSRVSGLFDGAPLNGDIESLAAGLIVPALWWFHRSFLSWRPAQVGIVLLALLKASASLISQDGWCVRFDLAEPVVKDHTGRPHSWDVRADWRSPDPACSAVMTRGYAVFKEFPTWFFNLRPVVGNQVQPGDRPPYATFDMRVLGYLDARDGGVLEVQTGPYMKVVWLVDGRPMEPADRFVHRLGLDPGLHFIQATITMQGNEWRLMPTWNQSPMGAWSFPTMTTTRPGPFDQRFVRLAIRFLTMAIGTLLIAGWLIAAIRGWGHAGLTAWAVMAAAWLGYFAPRAGNDFRTGEVARWSVTLLAAAALVPAPERWRNLRGAFILIGIPWLAFIGTGAIDHVDKFSFYHPGDDQGTFQRFSYRIFLEGYWLEGGSVTFWFQPGYRWIAGALHMLFGDTSIGEFFWDGAGILAFTLFAFEATRRLAGFRWGLVAAATSLTVVMRGPTWGFWGIGLSENASAAFIYMAALTAMNARRWPAMAGAGALATLGFYTRLNHLPLALAVAVFAVPAEIRIRELWTFPRWANRINWRLVAGVAGVVSVGIFLFTLRTWYYTGIFSMFHGTTLGHNGLWQPGLPAGELMRRMADSVWMVLSMNDPPKFAWYAMPLIAAAAISALAIVGVPLLRDLPLVTVLFFVAGWAGALVARGEAYAGRFSTIVIGSATAVTVSFVALLVMKARGAANRS